MKTKDEIMHIFMPAFDMLYIHSKNPIEYPYHYFIGKTILISLACEMGLKALIIQNEKEPKHTHKLDILFNQLESGERNYIIDNSQYNETDFLDKIAKNNSHFEEWRYHHEYDCNEVDFIFMDYLISILAVMILPEQHFLNYFPND